MELTLTNILVALLGAFIVADVYVLGVLMGVRFVEGVGLAERE